MTRIGLPHAAGFLQIPVGEPVVPDARARFHLAGPRAPS